MLFTEFPPGDTDVYCEVFVTEIELIGATQSGERIFDTDDMTGGLLAVTSIGGITTRSGETIVDTADITGGLLAGSEEPGTTFFLRDYDDMYEIS